jgi:NTP pyrophosphatase (non-canonical NTP hydrolase)
MDSLKEIQAECNKDSEEWFPHIQGSLGYHVLALCGEVGELANLLKKVQRGSDPFDAEMKNMMANELIDAFTYIMTTAGVLGVDVGEAYSEKRAYNYERFGTSIAGTLKAVDGGV